MKLLFLLLIFPCCIHAQKIGQINGTFRLTKADVRKAIATNQDALIVLAHRVFMGAGSKVRLVDYWCDTLTLAIEDTAAYLKPYTSCAEFAAYAMSPWEYEQYKYDLANYSTRNLHKWSVDDNLLYKGRVKENLIYNVSKEDTTTVGYIFFIGRHGECAIPQMRAYSPAGNSLVSDDSNHIKVYYQSTDTCINSHKFRKEMSDSFNVNSQKALILMRKKGCMQRQSCRDSIWYFQGKSISYLELEHKF